MRKALREVQLSDLVGNLAEGFNTEIGEKGTCLSGGEKQRLALARLVVSELLNLSFWMKQHLQWII